MQVFTVRSFAVATAIAAAMWTMPSYAQSQVLTGQGAFTDYSKEQPGTRRHLTVADLPVPYASKGVDNGPELVPRPDDAWPQAPAGFKVDLYYTGLDQPRLIRTAPNGDLFVALSYQNKVMVFRGVGADGKAKEVSTFADNLSQPFGIQFYPASDPKWVYVGNTDSVVRFPYHVGDTKATGPAEKLADLPGVLSAQYLTLADEQIRGNCRKYPHGLLLELHDEAQALAALREVLANLPHADAERWMAIVFRPLGRRITRLDFGGLA